MFFPHTYIQTRAFGVQNPVIYVWFRLESSIVLSISVFKKIFISSIEIGSK